MDRGKTGSERREQKRKAKNILHGPSFDTAHQGMMQTVMVE
jgi:hypothetical protein